MPILHDFPPFTIAMLPDCDPESPMRVSPQALCTGRVPHVRMPNNPAGSIPPSPPITQDAERLLARMMPDILQTTLSGRRALISWRAVDIGYLINLDLPRFVLTTPKRVKDAYLRAAFFFRWEIRVLGAVLHASE